MADVSLTVYTIDNKTPATGLLDGKEQVMASADTYLFPNTGVEMIHINGGAAGGTLTIKTPQTVEGLNVAESPIILASGENYLFGPYPSKTYNDADGMVSLTSDVEDMEVIIFKKASG